MVFMGKRSAKQREDAIAERLRHVAFVAMHGVHHELQGWIDQCPRFFRVKVARERGEPGQVGKERGDSLAFTIWRAARFHCCSLGLDAFGQVLRRVDRWGWGSRDWR